MYGRSLFELKLAHEHINSVRVELTSFAVHKPNKIIHYYENSGRKSEKIVLEHNFVIETRLKSVES